MLNAVDAKERGAEVMTRTACTNLVRHKEYWEATLVSAAGTETRQFKAVVNAAGGWVDEIIDLADPQDAATHLRLVKGSHIIVPKWHEGEHAYIFQNADGRIVFSIPYEDDFTLIGTTDVDVKGNPEASSISDEEIDYLCDAVSAYFEEPVQREQIVWSYAGIRPLFDEDPSDADKAAQQATRDYVLDFHGGDSPMLNVFGGKITTYRRLAEEAVNKFAANFPDIRPAWTRGATLPGGDMAIEGHAAIANALIERCDGLSASVAQRWARTYGSDSTGVLGGAKTLHDLGIYFGGGLYEAEVDYLIANEWARCSDDVLWRRTKLGLHLDTEAVARLEAFIATRLPTNGHCNGEDTAHD